MRAKPCSSTRSNCCVAAAPIRAVRDGATEARVEGRFVVGDDEVVLARVIPTVGRSRGYVNGRLATASELVEKGRELVDLHGQHSHQSLLAPAEQRALLDRAAGQAAVGALRELQVARAEIRRVDDELAGLGGDDRARAHEVDLLRYQVAEIDAAAVIAPDEDEQLMMSEHMYLRTFQPPRGGTGDPRLLDPQARPLETRDGYICVSANTNAQAFALFDAIGRPELKADPRFSSVTARYENVAAYFSIRAEALRQKSTAEWLEIFERLDVPAMPYHTLDTLLDDPHLADVGFFQITGAPDRGQNRRNGRCRTASRARRARMSCRRPKSGSTAWRYWTASAIPRRRSPR